MNFTKKLVLTVFSSALLFSCSTNEPEPEVQVPLGAYDRGVLILNQGGFNSGNASMSYLSNDFGTFQNNIFSVVNPSTTLGDTGQDVGFYNNLAFIVMNGSNKIEIVNRYTMVKAAAITTGLNNPRNIAFANGKAFVTNWGNGSNPNDDYVAIIDLSNYTISGNIAVVEGPEKIIVANSRLYVAHEGGYNFGNTITVINPATNAVTNSIAVKDVPKAVKVVGNDLYVLCGGKPSWSGTETLGSLDKIDLSLNVVTRSIAFPLGLHPSNMDISGNNLYYNVGTSIYSMAVTSITLPTSAVLNITAQGVNGTGIYCFSVANNKIYIGDAGNYSANGKVYIYSLANVYERTFTVGIIPAGFYFN